ncbi:MAG: hypothetical protein AAFV33_19005 [Chloroflexota bacterium]
MGTVGKGHALSACRVRFNADMTRYTDPNHPDFWQPDWAKTPGTDDTES